MPSEEAFWSSVITDWLFSHTGWSFLPFMMMMILVFAAFMVAFVLFLYMISPLISPKPLKLNGAHVVVSPLVSIKLMFSLFYSVYYLLKEKKNHA